MNPSSSSSSPRAPLPEAIDALARHADDSRAAARTLAQARCCGVDECDRALRTELSALQLSLNANPRPAEIEAAADRMAEAAERMASAAHRAVAAARMYRVWAAVSHDIEEARSV